MRVHNALNEQDLTAAVHQRHVIRIPTELNTVGDHIRKKRLDLKMLQREVGERIGVGETSVFTWEANRSQPDLKYMPAVIRFLGYSPLPAAKGWGKRLVWQRTALGLSQKEAALKISPWLSWSSRKMQSLHPLAMIQRGLNRRLPDTESRDKNLRVHGRNVMGSIIYEIRQSVNCLERRQDVDAAKIGMTGISFGGITMFCTWLVDDRIAAALAPFGNSSVTARQPTMASAAGFPTC